MAKGVGQLPLEDCRGDIGVDDDVAHAGLVRREASSRSARKPSVLLVGLTEV